jgi:hypothetical protein
MAVTGGRKLATSIWDWLFSDPDKLKKAKEQGWNMDDPQFHWTTGDVKEFAEPTASGKAGKAVYMSPTDQGGKRYLHKKGKKDTYKVDKEGNEYFPEGSNVMPLVYRGNLAPYSVMIKHAQDYLMSTKNATREQAFDNARDMLQKEGFTGVRVNDNEVAVFDPKNVRSPNAKFDPEKSNSRNILASGAGLMTAITAALQSNEAEAGVLPSANKVLRMIQLGMLDEANAGNLSQIKSAATKYDKAVKSSKGFRAQEARAAENDYETTFLQMALPEGKVLDPSSLQGEIFMPVKGDKSDIGILRQIGGIDIPDTNIQGGRKYAQQHQGTGEAWASNISAATSAYNKAKAVAKANDGQAPIGVHHAMGDDATNFSTALAEPIMHMFYKNRNNIAKADVAKFDKALRQGVGKNAKNNSFPEWVGLDHPDAMDQLMGRNGYPNIGNNRTAFTNMMARSGVGKDLNFRDRGFPSVNEIYRAVNEDWQKGAELGDAGGVMFRFDTDTAPYMSDSHKSYSHSIAGDYVGQLERQVPYEIMYPSMWRELGKHTDKHGRPLPRTQQMNTGAMDHQYFQKADQEWVDTVGEFLRNASQRIASPEARKKAALATTLAAGSGSALASPDAPTKANANDMYNMFRAAQAEAEQLQAQQRDPLNPSMDGLKRDPNAISDTLGSIYTGVKQGLARTMTPEGFLAANMQALGVPEAGRMREEIARAKAPDYKPKGEMSDEARTLWQLLGNIAADPSPF